MDEQDKTTLININEFAQAKSKKNVQACLTIIDGNDIGRMFRLEGETITIGRDKSADICLTDTGISRKHAEIKRDDGYRLKDCNSTNGTFCNEERIDFHYLNDGDQIQLAKGVVLRFSYVDETEEKFQKRLFNAAIMDGLTGIYNKKYFLERYETEVNLSKRHKTFLSLSVFDIDFFKKVNDTYGHAAGDYVLKTLAHLLKPVIRAEDLFARYGGEEFVFLLPHTDVKKAILLADRARMIVERHNFEYDGKRIPITISLGVAEAISDSKLDPDKLFKLADKRLYTAKRSGRNRVVGE